VGLAAEKSWFDSRQSQEIFLFSFASILTLEHIKLSNQWVPVALSPVVKRPALGGDHSHPSGAEIKNDWG